MIKHLIQKAFCVAGVTDLLKEGGGIQRLNQDSGVHGIRRRDETSMQQKRSSVISWHPMMRAIPSRRVVLIFCLFIAARPAFTAPSLGVDWSHNVNGAIVSSGNPSASAAPLTGGAGGVAMTDLSARYGRLRVIAHGEIHATNFAGWHALATGNANFYDELTITLPGGGNATVHASYRIVGTTTSSGSSEGTLGMNWGTQVIVPGTTDSRQGGVNPSGSGPGAGPLNGTITVNLPAFTVTSGVPFSIYATAGASGGAVLAANGQGVADANLALEWLGFTVTDTGGTPVEYTLTSQSGVNWSLPASATQPGMSPLDITGDPVNGFQLGWDCLPGYSYQLQYSATLESADWHDLGPVRTAPLGRLSHMDVIAPGTPRRFYRLRRLEL